MTSRLPMVLALLGTVACGDDTGMTSSGTTTTSMDVYAFGMTLAHMLVGSGTPDCPWKDNDTPPRKSKHASLLLSPVGIDSQRQIPSGFLLIHC